MAARKRQGKQLTGSTSAASGGSLLIVMAAVLAVAIGLAIWQVVERQQARDLAAERRAVVEAAERGVVAWATVDFREVEEYFKSVDDVATGAFRDEFRQAQEQLPQVLADMKSIQVPEVPEDGVGLVELNGKKAKVLVALDATVSNRVTQGPEPREYRMQVEMTKVGAKWLISQLEFVS